MTDQTIITKYPACSFRVTLVSLTVSGPSGCGRDYIMEGKMEICAYCHQETFIVNYDPRHGGEEVELIPSSVDDEAWEELAQQHADDCEWITTRAHQIN